MEAISTAQEEYIQKKMTFAAAADQLLEASRGGELGDTAPVWVPDARVAMCQLCCAEFSLMVRRHHCRACGKVVCGACSGSKAPVKYKQFEAVRVCSQCCEKLIGSKYFNFYICIPDKGSINVKFIFSSLAVYYNHPQLMCRFKLKSQSVREHVPPRFSAVHSETAQMSGYLKLKTRGKWRQSWWVLAEHVLYRYVAVKDPRAVETIPVLGWTLETLSDVSNHTHTLDDTSNQLIKNKNLLLEKFRVVRGHVPRAGVPAVAPRHGGDGVLRRQ